MAKLKLIMREAVMKLSQGLAEGFRSCLLKLPTHIKLILSSAFLVF